MSGSPQATSLIADDDADDRILARDALVESYLNRRGKCYWFEIVELPA